MNALVGLIKVISYKDLCVNKKINIYLLYNKPQQMNYSSGRKNHISDVMISMLALSVVDCGFKPRSDQSKEYKINICCFL